jgi:hypothetical protein
MPSDPAKKIFKRWVNFQHNKKTEKEMSNYACFQHNKKTEIFGNHAFMAFGNHAACLCLQLNL